MMGLPKEVKQSSGAALKGRLVLSHRALRLESVLKVSTVGPGSSGTGNEHPVLGRSQAGAADGRRRGDWDCVPFGFLLA